MAPCSCSEQINTLQQQITVMRREIKNIRQHLEGAVRAHRKHVASLRAELEVWRAKELPEKNPAAQNLHRGAEPSLEQGRIQTDPIGFISSCFSSKNGTPRQPAVCVSSRASLQIQPSVFNNPEHALSGLELYSHIWLVFLFHKNGHLSCRAKVRPPRLNGQRVGVYSTRSPHRPNAIGLSLARLESVSGDTLHLSGVDLISGTPVLDIKPYIPDYDSPNERMNMCAEYEEEKEQNMEDSDSEADVGGQCSEGSSVELDAGLRVSAAPSEPSSFSSVLAKVREYLQQGALCADRTFEEKPSEADPESESRLCYGEDSYSRIAAWIRDAPVSRLSVRFTPSAERELAEFLPPDTSDSGGPRFQFLKGPVEAAEAVRGILAADPRSVYRRTRCSDRLFFFSLDTADITCWFGDGFAEVLRVRPVLTPGVGS